MRKILIIALLLLASTTYGQYDGFYKSVIKKSNIFNPLKGSFIVNRVKTKIVNGESRKLTYSYLFKNQSLKLEYCYPESKSDNGCSYFLLNGYRVNLKGNFESDFACDLDVTSFNMYKGQYKGKKYILLTGINNGSGSSTSSIICILFDITNKGGIKYYPLWSKYGGKECFGDFNNDGVLDFLKVRNEGDDTTLKLTLMSLNKSKFLPYKEDYYIKLKYNGQKLKVIERHWFD